jgi:hypothetical protein
VNTTSGAWTATAQTFTVFVSEGGVPRFPNGSTATITATVGGVNVVGSVTISTTPPPKPVIVTQTPNTCRVVLDGSAPDAQVWTATIRNMTTSANVGTTDSTPDANGRYQPSVSTLTLGQTYTLAIQWTRTGAVTQTSPSQTVTVKCGG